MSFTQAALVVVALAAIGLALVCYSLLSRLELLERAIDGGLTPPSRRLAREEFEQRFRRALARSAMARQVEHGLVVVLGSEAGSSDAAGALAELSRSDGIRLMCVHPAAEAYVASLSTAFPSAEASDDLGVVATPFVFVIDEGRVRQTRTVPTAEELIGLLREHT
ncbi:MAG: hypothetical protein AAF567_07740 [Actinomycetota bacterium]